MIILLHVLIASTSLGYATYVFLSPSESKFKVAYTLVAGTFISGFYLVWSKQAHILSTCITGLCYLAAVTCLIAAAQYRLALAKRKIR